MIFLFNVLKTIIFTGLEWEKDKTIILFFVFIMTITGLKVK